ncbi:hypothetical protein ACGF1Z_04455 [Streptomyces sp. NPDC048018]|uniref:hypothetical protein n=1 Tax=Streptomyces sp. NPDC048018 TaxID=3365499 RepID=UPI003711CD54
MSFDEEWAAEKAAVSMRLNQADSTGGSTPAKGTGDYEVEDDDLGDIGHAAHGLFSGREPGGKHADAVSETAVTSLKGDGFDAGARPSPSVRRTRSCGPGSSSRLRCSATSTVCAGTSSI